MTGLVLSQDKKAAFEVRPVTTKKSLSVSLEGFDDYRVKAKRVDDGRVFVRIGCKTASVEGWRTFGREWIDENLKLPTSKPISFADALAAQPEWEVPRKGLWISMFWGNEEPVGPTTEGAVKVEQAERVRRARGRTDAEIKEHDKAISRNKAAHELLEPMLASIEEALR
jgi:hypothetical protein